MSMFSIPVVIFSYLLFCFCHWVEVTMFVNMLMCLTIFCILFYIKFFLFRGYGYVFNTVLFFVCYVNASYNFPLLSGSFKLISCSYSWVDLSTFALIFCVFVCLLMSLLSGDGWMDLFKFMAIPQFFSHSFI